MRKVLQVLWFVLSLIPAAFLFHYWEYGQHLTGVYLSLTTILFVLIVGLLSVLIKNQYMILINTLAMVLSITLASNFIVDDGWFKPVGRDLAIVFTAFAFLIGQLIVKLVAKRVLTDEV